MLPEGIRPIGDGLLEVATERLQGLIVKEDINEIYEVEPAPFARGKFAAVRRVVHKKTGIHFAAKFLRRRRRAQCTLKEIGHEIAILMMCADSKHIVKLNSVHETKTETALVLELATGGELQAILDEEDALTEVQAQICMREILKALQYLHKKYIAHLDLKPQNILLCGEKVEDGLKLCDFGISRIVEDGGKVREILGTPDYVAPEVLQYEPLSLKTDIWSVGVLTYVLLTGCSPFGGNTKQETFLNISQCALTFPDELFQDVSLDAIDFIKAALQIKPHERMSASECLAHRWLNEDVCLRLSTSTSSSPAAATITNSNTIDDGVPHTNGTHSNLNIDAVLAVDCKDYLEEKVNNCISSQNGDSLTKTTTNGHHSSESSIIINQQNGLTQSNFSHKQTSELEIFIKHNDIDDTNCVRISNGCDKDDKMITNIKDYNNKENILDNRNKSTSTQRSQISEEIIHINGFGGKGLVDSTKSKINSDDVEVTVIMNGSASSSSPPSSSSTTYETNKHQTSSLFPDAPTTPKVCRKSSPDSPPSVKTLVKKFQLDSSDIGADNVDSASAIPTSSTVAHVKDDETYCSIHCNVNCMPCGTGCRQLNSRKSIGIEQGIIC